MGMQIRHSEATTTTQHTPGPWIAKPTRVNGWDSFEILADDKQIVLVMGYREECPANARLIAAAPDLLAALAYLVAHNDNLCAKNGQFSTADADGYRVNEAARAAIRKAQG